MDYDEPPQIIFTGDSRTKNGIVPEVISRVLGVPGTTLFNFGTGSQVVKFAREAFVPHLLQIGIRPAYVVFGVSPDWSLRKERLWALIDRYRDSLAYRIANQSRHGPDLIEARLARFLALRLALFRYRADLIHQELIPSLRCWFLGDCDRPAGDWRGDRPLHFRDLERRSGFKTAAGWGPQPYDGHTSGWTELPLSRVPQLPHSSTGSMKPIRPLQHCGIERGPGWGRWESRLEQ